jgi:hypothetical protein
MTAGSESSEDLVGDLLLTVLIAACVCLSGQVRSGLRIRSTRSWPARPEQDNIVTLRDAKQVADLDSAVPAKKLA